MPHLLKNVINKMFYSSRFKALIIIITCLLISACGDSSSNSGSSNGQINLSGKITVQRDSDVDLDLNQTNTLNNDIDDPQFIANPSTVGGYLSGSSGTFSSSNLPFNEDMDDYFRVSLVEGQEIQLSVFQADTSLSTIELELVLLDESKQVQASLLIDNFSSSSLIVPSDGLYTLSLTTTGVTSPLLYTLSLSQTISTQTLSDSDIKILSQDFILGDVLLKFKKEVQTNSADNTINNATLNTKLYGSSSNQSQKEYLLENLVFKESIPEVADLYQVRSFELKQGLNFAKNNQDLEPEVSEKLTVLEAKIQTLELIKELNANDLIEFAEPNFIYRASASTNDPRLSDQWNLSMLSLPAAWEVATGLGVVVAVLDTGINPNHEDLMKNIHAEGYDFISDSKSSGDGNGFDTNPNDEGSSFHGSHVAGVIAAEADNALGVAGLAYDSKIMPLRVLGVQDTGASSDIAQAILYAAGLSNTSGIIPNQPADIINMSFGGEALSETVKAAIDRAYNKGLILVAAAGNGSTDKLFYPAAFENVIGVGAVSDNKKRSSFSNFGNNVQVVAPGGTGSGSATFDGFQDAILSTINENNYAEYIGTSMAAPHVSAVAALMKEIKANLNGQSFKVALDGGFLTDIVSGSSPDTNNFYGKGLINAAKALNWASGTTIIPAILDVYPTKFGFIGSNTEAELTLTNPGNGEVTVISVEEQEDWLKITQKTVDGTTLLGTYIVEANPSLATLDQGLITISYKIGNAQIQQQTLNVFISRSNQTDSTVGVLFVSLYKEEDILNDIYEPVLTVGGKLNNGSYIYSFNSVPSGRYLLSASTDNDRDQESFDSGEAIGTFPLLSRPEFIEVSNSTLADINFDIQYPSFITSKETITTLRKKN